MCGIIGCVYSGLNQKFLKNNYYKNLIHRGPDAKGYYSDENCELGHTRLSILDLSENGNQPKVSSDGRYVLTFNGEIYNYLEIKKKILNSESFNSNSDTEVILPLFKKFGKRFYEKLRGAFAICIWDTLEKKLFLIRDRFGEKPLFFTKQKDKFFFASELKAIVPIIKKKNINFSSFNRYLHYQCTPGKLSLIEDVYKLPRACFLELKLENLDIKLTNYWNLNKIPTNYEKEEKSIYDQLNESVQIMLRSDAKLGLSLSSGIDSSIISYLAKKNSYENIEAICVGYENDDKNDETKDAYEFSKTLKLNFNLVRIKDNEIINDFPDLVNKMDEPIGDLAAYSIFRLNKKAKELDIKVLINGIGGDEIFWGYHWVNQAIKQNIFEQQNEKKLKKLPKFNFGKKFENLLRKINGSSKYSNKFSSLLQLYLESQIKKGDENLKFFSLNPTFDKTFELKKKFFNTEIVNESPFYLNDLVEYKQNTHNSKIISEDLFDCWLEPDCLTLSDRLGMSCSIENRSPFLDHNLLENIIFKQEWINGYKNDQKEILRNLFKNKLPDKIINRRKKGFTPPKKWMLKIVNYYFDFIKNGYLNSNNLLNNKEINGTYKFINKNSVNFFERIHKEEIIFFMYKLIIFELWYNKI